MHVAFVNLRHPELKLKIPAWVFCVSWCPDFEFRGTYRVLVRAVIGLVRALGFVRAILAAGLVAPVDLGEALLVRLQPRREVLKGWRTARCINT